MNQKHLPLRYAWIIVNVLWFLLQTTTGKAQSVTVSSERYQVDNSLRLIICNQIPVFPRGQSLPTIRFDKDYVFTQPVSSFQVGQGYPVKTGSTPYTLYFTNFPLVKITTAGQQAISTTNARTKGTITLANGNDPLFSTPMGIRIRGNISRGFPKKQYNVQLWKDPNGDEELETSLLGLREDSKILLFAMYNEPLRLQNATSQALWLNMHKLYYQASEPDANSAIRMKYCDVFVNNSYAGIYMLGEDMDRKQLKLKKTGDNGALRGELYKTSDGFGNANQFLSVPPPPTDPNVEEWSGFEMDYPDPYWDNLYSLLAYAVKAPANEFSSKLPEKFRVDNLIDYYILLNLLAADDHWGNNQFIARYKENEPYFLIPWDMDATFGYNPIGIRSEEARLIKGNGLFDRLLALDPDGFKQKMRKRWFALRQNELALSTLKNALAANYNLLTAEGGYAREAMKWPGTLNPGDFPAVNTWLENRVNFLDEYFSLFPEETGGKRLAYFQGEPISGSNKLKWAFRSGTQATNVEIEHSGNGTDFGTVGTVAVNGPTAEGPYEFTHAHSASPAFYRLKIFTGQTATYSATIQLGGNTCPSAPPAPNIRASVLDVTTGQSVVLTANGCSQTVVWNTGQTGAVVMVNPTETTSYTAKCRQAIGCESAPSSTVKVNVYPQNAIPGSYEGYLGGVDCNFIRGWAWDRNKPNTPVYVDILDGQNLITTLIAGVYRQDLKDAGKGNGSHSYSYTVPETVKDNQLHSISARIRGTGFTLKDSARKLTCAGTTPPPTGNQPPVAPSVTALTGKVNTAFSATLPAFSDPDSPALTYSLTGLPSSLSFTAATRTIAGTPTATTTRSLTYTASDGTLSTSVTVPLTITDASTPPPATVTGNFEGYLDKVECESIRGWVWDRNKPNEAFTVEFFANGQSIGTARADIFRQDLKDAGKGNGYHVYNFPTPSSVKTGQAVSISAKVQNSDYVLKQAPKSLTCAGSGTPVNQPPVAPSVTALTGKVNTAFSATLPAFSDPDSPALTYSLTGLPSSLSFTAATRTIAGTPTATTTRSLTYTASDGTLSTSVTVPLTITDASTPPPATVTGNFEGYLDKVECESIRGWVWDRNKPNEAFTVEFFANGQSIGTARADIFRQDLKDAGKGNGYHVYNFPTPSSVKTGQAVSISAKVQNSNYTLAWSPKQLTCAPNARVGASTESEDAGLVVTPNPTSGEFEIQFSTTQPTASELSILDELGRNWYRKQLEGTGAHRLKVRLSGANGLYLIQLREGNQLRSRKVLIQP
ncbi:CotH kinase family protein [Larkinella bovis]|uniref:CotH kinase family protein n=1 Tax=Larkinella bovis TaxID=683041 RepID=A0ABW0I7F9_9BACT